VSAPGRPKREHRSAEHEGRPASAPGRPKREHRSAEHEGGPAGFDALAAITIHDVKNRLAALAGRAEVRGDAETLAVALDAAGTLTRLLVFYRATTGSLTLDVDAHAPADLAADLVREAAGAARWPVDCRFAGAPTLWFYDQALVRMVLANALQNAQRFARSRVVLTVAGDEDSLRFVVRDDGPGFSAALLADVAAARVTAEGTGLGLRLAGRVAALHQNAGRRGDVVLANNDGGVFTLRLPH
jgi:signal transduction histidine kinase